MVYKVIDLLAAWQTLLLIGCWIMSEWICPGGEYLTPKSICDRLPPVLEDKFLDRIAKITGENGESDMKEMC